MNGTSPRCVTRRTPKARTYIHFDPPLSEATLKSFSIGSKDVIKHSFFPLLGYEKVTRKIDFSVFPPVAKAKPRKIRYAAHFDSAIYSTYAQDLVGSYEAFLKEHSLGDVVLAYRSGIGYNVPFAKSLIDEIRMRGDCRIICLDLSKFFDRIPHNVLKAKLCQLLLVKRLPDDWFRIFERITNFEYVLTEDLENKIGRLRGPKICEIDTFRSAVRPLIKLNCDDNGNQLSYGIPQGTPLSGLFANVVMMDFDLALNQKLLEIGGSYRRYSDDIAIALPNDSTESEVLSFATDFLKKYGLSFNEEKTCKTNFTLKSGRQHSSGDVFQYLGFTFDGNKILIRPESIKNFYARMKRNIRRYIISAAKEGIPISKLRKRVLVGRFTHWGDNRNFVQYAYRASRELQAPEIKKQLRNHVEIFNRQWEKISSEC